ncbi:MAG: potassium-transporting ATPase subunit C [Ktedonobacterales bacterium]
MSTLDPPTAPTSLEVASVWSTAEMRSLLKMTLQALRLLVILTVLCGIIFPLLLFGIGQAAFPAQANGSLIKNSRGQTLGSSLIGQQFTNSAYFQGRPSAVGYNAAGSGRSAIGPTNPQLLYGNGSDVTVAPGTPPPAGATPVAGKPNTYYVPGSYLGVVTYAKLFREENGLAPNTPLPADIVTASGSGLDPDISVAAAYLEVNRVVAARKALGGKNSSITVDQVNSLVAQHIQWPLLGFVGDPYVNVLQINLALDAIYGPPVKSAGAPRQSGQK